MPPTILTDDMRDFKPINFLEEGNTTEEIFKNYIEIGTKIMEWANGIGVPTDMADLRAQLDGLIDIPEGVKNLKVLQGDDSDKDNAEFVLRLPPRNQLNESEYQLTVNDEDYRLPGIYENAVPNGSDLLNDPVNMLRARVADYTMRGCR